MGRLHLLFLGVDTMSGRIYNLDTDSVSALKKEGGGKCNAKGNTGRYCTEKRRNNQCLRAAISDYELSGDHTQGDWQDRPTIYNYFVTKEEIFLALFKREYDRWNEQLTAILDQNEELTKTQLADQIAQSLAERQQLLKLLSMNNYDMEANSRQEMLTIFKQSYGGSLHRMGLLLEKFCPDMEEADIQNFLYTFFPFMFGIYPYTAVTEKQKAAMKDAGINYVYLTVYDLAYSCLTRLLGN